MSSQFVAFVLDQLRAFGAVEARRMFGGAGLYRAGRIFGLVANDTLYFKVNDANRAAYEAAGMGPFTYQTKNGPNTISSYWEVPAAAQENPDELAAWAHAAFAAAKAAGDRQRRGSKTEPQSPRRTPRRIG